MSRTQLLVGSCHLGPALVVTTLTAGLARGRGLGARRATLVTATVLTGQLTIGWLNDLTDRHRDAATGRPGKPLATPGVSARPVVVALAATTAATVVLGACTGRRAGAVHAVAVVGSGWAYDLGLKATAASPAPYAVAFGALPQVVALADPRTPRCAPVRQSVAGALLGCGAHLLDALPDLALDETTGVRGLPHRLGARRSRHLAGLVLAAGHATVVAGRRSGGAVPLGLLAAAGVWAGRGTVPFWSAAALAAVDVAASTRASGHPVTWG